MNIKREDAEIFIKGLESFFSFNLDDTKGMVISEIRTCDTKESLAYDFTGIIGISGERKGCLYFTAQKSFVTEILKSMGETDIDSELLSDLTGEVANTIAGHAMSRSDQSFELSVPVVVTGRPDSIDLPKNISAYVVSVAWKEMFANLVICIE